MLHVILLDIFFYFKHYVSRKDVIWATSIRQSPSPENQRGQDSIPPPGSSLKQAGLFGMAEKAEKYVLAWILRILPGDACRSGACAHSRLDRVRERRSSVTVRLSRKQITKQTISGPNNQWAKQTVSGPNKQPMDQTGNILAIQSNNQQS